ncbi:PadR family transcriptional regulator [Lachnospiraceae bacterium LCP25S3_G4]
MSKEKEIIDSLNQELRRGTLILSVLSQLKEAKYGYALVQSLEHKGFPIDPNTLYPLLRRLEKQGLLISEWEMGESKPRKYYHRTAMGDQVYVTLKEQWDDLSIRMNELLKGDLV